MAHPDVVIFDDDPAKASCPGIRFDGRVECTDSVDDIIRDGHIAGIHGDGRIHILRDPVGCREPVAIISAIRVRDPVMADQYAGGGNFDAAFGAVRNPVVLDDGVR
ncbi:hypothetical protein D1872_223720 [compost metagenome]